jgi:signal transduction histidine kinase
MINAIQAMPSGGELRIGLTVVHDKIVFSFHDDGPGFTSAALDRGEELFFTEKEGGMGVGLNVAQEIISAHEGQMTLKNHPEEGALVEITLPMSKS